jgi:RNA polymerase sigma factor (sigma-70 family)
MTGNEPSAVARMIQTLFRVGTVGGLTDGQLLERVATRRDAAAEAAFEALVQRHGPMVWGVCRRVLDNPHDAADAFQATFLVLVRRAAAVRVDDSLGRWLYGVSRRVAVRAKKTTARRSARERRGVETAVSPDPASDRSELLAALDEEIGRLPERYRAVVVLCDLGGLTHEEAARQLGCAVGTVGSRLARGRERLRDRLTHRGLVPSAGLVGVVTSVNAVSAAVPRALVDSTIRAALRGAAGEAAVVAANVLALSEGVLRAMLLTRLKVVAALALLMGAGLIILSYEAASETQAPPAARQGGAPTGRAADSPEQIIAVMAKTYADARSYEDEGEVTIVFVDGPTGRFTVKRPFSTKFVRPKLYRYEFTERAGDGEGERKRFVIWSDAAPERSRYWWTVQPKIEEGPLAMSIASGTGISGGSAFTVPNLLMPDTLPGPPLTGLKDLKLVGEEAVDEAPCYKIEGKSRRGDPETAWIDKATSLVRKIFTTNQIPGTAVEQTTTYRPRVNVEIPPQQFVFEPPKP